jgi:hypothetical protein
VTNYEDLYFFYNLFTLSQDKEILVLALMPYLSLSVVETYKYFKKVYPSHVKILNKKHEIIIQKSRLRVKFFDINDNIIERLEYLDWIKELHFEWFVNRHNGYLEKNIQPDLGIFIYNGHIIGSTHTFFFNLGYEKEFFPIPNMSLEIDKIMKELTFNVAKSIGAYYGELSISRYLKMNIKSRNGQYIKGKFSEQTQTKDRKSDKFYNCIFEQELPCNIKMSLLLLLSSINFLNYVIPEIIHDIHTTYFKIKYITLYHTLISLKKIQSYGYREKKLSDKSKDYLGKIIKDKHAKLIISEPKFRNVLIHYGMSSIPIDNLDVKTELYGLVEYFFNGMSYFELNSLVNSQINRISIILEEWLNLPIESENFSSITSL